jgi:hypothetical protein
MIDVLKRAGRETYKRLVLTPEQVTVTDSYMLARMFLDTSNLLDYEAARRYEITLEQLVGWYGMNQEKILSSSAVCAYARPIRANPPYPDQETLDAFPRHHTGETAQGWCASLVYVECCMRLDERKRTGEPLLWRNIGSRNVGDLKLSMAYLAEGNRGIYCINRARVPADVR